MNMRVTVNESGAWSLSYFSGRVTAGIDLDGNKQTVMVARPTNQ
jgi:hypothetical protein